MQHDSLLQLYDKNCEVLQLPALEESEETAAAKYRLLSYIFSIEVFQKFINDFSLDEKTVFYDCHTDKYSFPQKLSSIENAARNLDNWSDLWELASNANMSDNIDDYIKEEFEINSDGVDRKTIVNSINKASSVEEYFGALFSYDKKPGLFKKEAGISETVLRNRIVGKLSVPIREYFSRLIYCLDSAVATMNTVMIGNSIYSYLRKGELSNRVFIENPYTEISTGAISMLYNSIGVSRFEEHYKTIESIYKASKSISHEAVLNDDRFRFLSDEKFEGFYMGTYNDLYQKYVVDEKKDKKVANEIEYFKCVTRYFPNYLNQCQKSDSSIEGFIIFLNNYCSDKDMVMKFVQGVS
jgi:hypothetical protein